MSSNSIISQCLPIFWFMYHIIYCLNSSVNCLNVKFRLYSTRPPLINYELKTRNLGLKRNVVYLVIQLLGGGKIVRAVIWCNTGIHEKRRKFFSKFCALIFKNIAELGAILWNFLALSAEVKSRSMLQHLTHFWTSVDN